jgi:hypothetical protein
MKYVIAGQYTSKGVIGDDSADLNVYYELGWEVTLTNIIAKTLLTENKLSKDDTIVTKNDRSFFYSKVFSNVIDWQDFKNINLSPNDEVYYLPKDIDNWAQWEKKLNKDLVCEFDLISNIEEKFNIEKQFGIYCIRLRDHCSWRNSDLVVARNTIKSLIEKYNKQIFIMGQNTEELAKELNVPSISLREFASLLNTSQCQFCISPMSGVIQIANFCGHNNLTNIIFDHNNERGPDQELHPLFMGNTINFKNTKNIFISGKETEENIIKILSDENKI